MKEQFSFVNKSHLFDFFYVNLCRVVRFLFCYTVYLLGSLFKYIFRSQNSRILDNCRSISNENDDKQVGMSCSADSRINHSDEGANSDVLETDLMTRTNRYEFLGGKGISGFLEEPRMMNFIVHELFVDSGNDTIISNSVFDTRESKEEEFYDVELYTEKAEETENFVKSFMVDELEIEEQEQEIVIEEVNSEEGEMVCDDGVTVDIGNQELDAEEAENSVENSLENSIVEEVLENQQVERTEDEMSCEKEQNVSDLGHVFKIEQDRSNEVQSISSSRSLSDHTEEEKIDQFVRRCEFDSMISRISDDKTEVGEQESQACPEEEKEEHIAETEPVDEQIADESRKQEEVFVRDQPTDSDDEYIEFQPNNHRSSSSSTEDFSNVLDEQSVQEKAEPKPDSFETAEKEHHSFRDQKSEKFEEDQSDTADYMYEHEDLIEQLKMELKLARTGGLPTILEESEAEELEIPETAQELKPMKIDEKKFEYKDLLEGIQKVYRSYLDKMRKLDILNFQTMHALGLLQMKDTAQFQTTWKSSVIPMTPINLWLCKRSAVVDPLKKIIVDMNRDFETIYVGQLCLSWEILHWQFWKVQELHKFESQEFHQYNQVAGEFQLFQVLIQRFIENEQFQGPRVQNYVKNRCVLSSLLQVPLVKGDCVKDKGKRGDEKEDAITSQMLTGMIEQSMRVFWEFLRADKDESSFIFHGNLQAHPNLQNFVDLELLTDVRTDFQKKDRRLKDILRSGNCIVKKFKKQQENGVHQTLLIAQVELKLISRVLNMTKLTTDQLIWCHEKLDKISFSGRKVFVESTFLLFPC